MKNEPVMQIKSSAVARRWTASQASAGVAAISVSAALTPDPLPKGEGSFSFDAGCPRPRPLSRLRARGDRRRQRLQLLGWNTAGIFQVAGENDPIEVDEQVRQHAAQVLFPRGGEDQPSPPDRKTLGKRLDQRLDRGRVVGRVEHHRRPPRDDFHPRRPNHLGQTATHRGVGMAQP